ncbi:shikimate dehydrogenase [Litorisediminicola beolgyonensis]|uniref:Shikimate dehydrogenase (NADP(+)) n=1 Tax=Litorisediminicola beolgyonensis TaxID=1173614 RepID=A0ABW3ZDE2_9RHOB
MSHDIPLAGVIGDPIAHSRSPQLHGHWLARYGISGHYVPLHVASGDLDTALFALPKMGFRGVNVTIPHKERALALATRVTDRAAAIGAANTLTFLPEGGFEADNTDALGFYENLRQTLPYWSASDGPALVLGAGGAARAVIYALAQNGAPAIRLANRTREKADALARLFPAVEVIDWADAEDAISGAATLVNTTALGMVGQASLDLSLDRLSPDTVVTDIVYNPLQTPLLVAAAEKGARTVDGLGMLLHQAVPGFARWFNLTPEVDDALREAVLK